MVPNLMFGLIWVGVLRARCVCVCVLCLCLSPSPSPLFLSGIYSRNASHLCRQARLLIGSLPPQLAYGDRGEAFLNWRTSQIGSLAFACADATIVWVSIYSKLVFVCMWWEVLGLGKLGYPVHFAHT